MLLHDALILSLSLFRRACAVNVTVVLPRYLDGLAEGLNTPDFSYYYSYRRHEVNSFLWANSLMICTTTPKKSIEAGGQTTYNGEAPGNFPDKKLLSLLTSAPRFFPRPSASPCENCHAFYRLRRSCWPAWRSARWDRARPNGQ